MNAYQELSNRWRKAELKWHTEAGRPRCEAITLKGTRCTRIGGLSKREVLVEDWDKPVKEWESRIEWRCSQH